MNTIFISPELKQEQKEFIQSSISKFDGEIGDDEKNVMINISAFNHYSSNEKIEKPYSMSFLSYKTMVNLEINPFKFQFETNYLENLFYLI